MLFGKLLDRFAKIVASILARVDPDFATSTSVGSEFVRVEVSVDVTAAPIIGIGARTLTADVSMCREHPRS